MIAAVANDYFTIDGATAVGAIMAMMTTIVGLVVWLVKRSESRQEKIGDRYFTHLEKSAEKSGQVHKDYAESIREMAQTVGCQAGEISKLTAAISDQTREVSKLARSLTRLMPMRAEGSE